MTISGKRWIIPDYDSKLQLKIMEELKVSPVLAQLCINRGMTRVDDIKNFIFFDPTDINDPFAFSQMHQAVSIIEDSIKKREKILIYGDYDVDGITATSLLYLYLKDKTTSLAYYIPVRLEEGYGLNAEAILWAHREGFKLIITVDCGISSISEVELAQSLGIKVVVTDHHTPPEVLPEAAAIINPKIVDNGYPFPDLAGVGVAWKLAQALEINSGRNEKSGKIVLEDYLDLVSLGTVADVVPLINENRIIVSLGLEKIKKAERPGIKALMKITGLTGLEEKPLTVGHIGFILAPRLNAVGRLAQGSAAVELLTGVEYSRCETQAKELDKMNCQRQELEGEILNQALQLIEETVDLDRDFVMVLASESWHSGVIGIVSSRLVEKFHRPVVLLAIEGDVAKGSARSIEGFDIYAAFKQCQDYLMQFGGHKMAAGVKIAKENIGAFQRAINDYAHGLINKDLLLPSLKVDLELDTDGQEELYIKDCERLFPFGLGNPQPVFVYRNLGIREAKAVGNNQSHLKVTFDAGQYCLDGIGFNLSHHLSWLNPLSRVDVAVTLEKNSWNGYEKVQAIIKDIKPHETNTMRPVVKLPLPSSEGIIWEDYRNTKDRAQYLIELLKKNDSCLIYVSSRENMESLKQLIIEASLPGVRLEECHGSQRLWQHRLALTKVMNKTVNTLIFAGALPGDLISADLKGIFNHLVFFHSPGNKEDFLGFTYLVSSSKGGRIHLLFNKKDLESLDHELNALFPDRELLGRIYRGVRYLTTSANQLIGSKEEILRKIKIEGFEQEKEKAFDAWISIMKELGLIKLTLLGNRYCLELIDNGNKCRLEDSPSYQKGMTAKRNFAHWAGLALSSRFTEEICRRS